MTILFHCPVCRTTYSIPDNLVRRNAGCRVCRHRFVIPAPPGMSDHDIAALVATDPLRPFLTEEEETDPAPITEPTPLAPTRPFPVLLWIWYLMAAAGISLLVGWALGLAENRSPLP